MVKTQETGNTINKHSIKIPAKSIHIAELVFLKIDLYKMNLLLALRDKIRYFGATFGTFLGNFGHFFVFLVTILILLTFWTIITLYLVWVSLSGQKI